MVSDESLVTKRVVKGSSHLFVNGAGHWSWSSFSPTTITNGDDKRGVLRSLPEAWRTNPVWTLGRAAGLVTPVGGENGKERKGGI